MIVNNKLPCNFVPALLAASLRYFYVLASRLPLGKSIHKTMPASQLPGNMLSYSQRRDNQQPRLATTRARQPMAGSPVTGAAKLSRRIAALLLAVLLPNLAFSADPPSTTGTSNITLDSIDVSSLPGDRVQVRFQMSAPPEQPLSFTIDNPARIALDFARTGVKSPRSPDPAPTGILQSINAVEAQGRTRVVLNLEKLAPYETRIEGNSVYLTLDANPAPIARAQTSVPVASKPARSSVAASSNALRNIDFNRGDKGQARIVITLPKSSTKVDVREENGQIYADFINTTVPESLQRRLDVADFATPVKTIETSPKDGNVRMVITPSGAFQQLAYQTGDTYTIEVKPVVKQTSRTAATSNLVKGSYTGEKLSLNFQNIEVRSVLQLIADFTGLNIVTSDSVQGSLTLSLKNVPWDQALDIILQSKDLEMSQTGNVIQIAPRTEIAARKKLEKEAEAFAPLRSELMRINYAKASDLATLLKDKENSLLSEQGNVTIDERTNTLLIQDTDDKLNELRRLITNLDTPQRQVQIESRIVIANNTFGKELGVRFGITDVERGGDVTLSTTGSANATTGAINSTVDASGLPIPVGGGTTTGISAPLPSLTDRLNVNLPAAIINGANPARLAFGILSAGFLLDLELSALQAEGRGEVVSNPRVITSNQKEAVIEQGTEIPYLEASSSGAATISFKKAVLALKVTPQITPDDRIIMDLQVNRDSVGQIVLLAGSAVPSIDTREVTTQVLVSNGETVVLGGVYEQTTRDQINRVPFFSDIPYLGNLFKQNSQTNNKSELLIFVTPKIVTDLLSLVNN